MESRSKFTSSTQFFIFGCVLLFSACVQRNIQNEVITYKPTQQPKVILWHNSNSQHNDEVTLKLHVRAGSLQEDDDQQGYAHFVEHMVFRGSEAYPGDALEQRMRELGITLGRHSNAYTSFDQTVYWISLSTAELDKVEAALELLSQWAYYAEFDPVAVEEERAVIIEEWRMAQRDASRVSSQLTEVLYSGSRYAERMPIGTFESIVSAQAEDLQRFYRQWYHPENMALIVTGELDTEQVKGWVDTYFNNPPEFRDRRRPEIYENPVTGLGQTVVVTDEYITTSRVGLLWLDTAHPLETTPEDWVDSLKFDLLLDVLMDRLSERIVPTQGAVSSFNYEVFGLGSQTVALEINAFLFGDEFELGTQLMLVELRDLLENGPTQKEMKDWQRWMLRTWRNYEDSADDLADFALFHLTDGAPLLSTPQELALMEKTFPTWTPLSIAEKVAEYLTVPPRVVVVHPTNMPAPSELDIQRWLDNAEHAVLLDELSQELDWSWPITPQYKGHIVSETKLENGVHKFQLSNGIPVYFKKNSSEPDKVYFRLVGLGGFNLDAEPEIFAARLTPDLLIASGLRGVSRSRINQWQAAEGISLSLGQAFYDRTVAMSMPVNQRAVALRYLHALLTEAELDEAAWVHSYQQSHTYLQQIEQHPHRPWHEKVAEVDWNNDPAFRSFTLEELNAITLEQLQYYYEKRWAGAQNYTVAISGNLRLAQVRALIRESIATLPPVSDELTPRLAFVPEHSSTHRVEGSGEQSAYVYLEYTLPLADAGNINTTALWLASEWLNEALFDQIRTREGLVYSISGGFSQRYLYDDAEVLSVSFATDPENVESVISQVELAMQTLLLTGPAESQIKTWTDSRRNDVQSVLRQPETMSYRMAYAELLGSTPEQMMVYEPSVVQSASIVNVLEAFLSPLARRTELVWLP